MQLTLKGVPLGTLLLLLLLVSISVPGKGILAGGKTWQGQPEVSALRQSETQEAVGFARTSDWRGPRLKVAANDPEGDLQGTSPHLQFAEEEKPWSSRPRFNIQAWPNGGPEEPVCRVKLDRAGNRAPNHLEVVGLLTSHESSFLKALSRSTWRDGDLEEFGMCPPDIPHSLLSSLQHIGGYLADPGDSRFLLLHLEEVQWKDETKLRFQLTFPEEVEPSIGPLQHALLVFYHGRKEGASTSPRKKYLVGGEGLHQKQIICLSGITRYLVLKGSLMSGRSIPGQLSFQVSLAIRHHSNRGVYRIPCSCGQVYIGTTKRSIQTRIKEHERHCRLGQPEKSAVAEHSLTQTGHSILFQDTKILDNTSNYFVRLHREAIEIHKHKQNFNRKEETLRMNRAWLPVLKNTRLTKHSILDNSPAEKISTSSTNPYAKEPPQDTVKPPAISIPHPGKLLQDDSAQPHPS